MSIDVDVAVSGLSATFTVTGATPPIRWGWGDGSVTATDADLSATHVYGAPGLYTAQLSAAEGMRPVVVGVGDVAVDVAMWISGLTPTDGQAGAGDAAVHIDGLFPSDAATSCEVLADGVVVPIGGTDATGINVVLPDPDSVDSVSVVVRDKATGALTNAAWFQWRSWPLTSADVIPTMVPIVTVVYMADTSVRYVNSVAQATTTPGMFADIAFTLVDTQPPGPTIPTSPDWLTAHATTPMLGDTALWRGDDGMGNVLDLLYRNSMYFEYPSGWTAADFTATGPLSEVFQPLRLDSAGTAYEPDPNGAPYTFTWTVVAAPPVAAAEAFDPGEYTVDEVVAYVGEHPDDLGAVYDAEVNGKARSTLLTKLEALGPT